MERNGEPEVSPHLHGQLIYDKGGRVIQQGKGLLKKRYWAKWTATSRRMKSDHFFVPYTRMDERFTCRTWNSWKETGGSFFDTDLSSALFGCVSSGKGNKSESKRMGLRGTKKLSRGQETINKTERQPLNGRRRLQIVYPRKGWYKNIEEIHITQYQTPKHPNQKMGGRPNTVFQRRHAEGRQAPEEMLK